MGKATAPKQKFQRDPKNISKHANSLDPEEAKSAKERMEAELHLLRLRNKTISQSNVSKPKPVIKKKAVNVKKQKKLARALLVADKEEARVQKTSEKHNLRKIGKRDWK